MNPVPYRSSTRREFLHHTGRIAAASALAGTVVPRVHAAENNTLHVALIGCGGRGTGAAVNALSVKGDDNIQLVAMADAFQDRLDISYKAITKEITNKKQIDVPADRKFVGLDAYQKAMDCLRPGDVAIFATPLAFRIPHFEYAIKKGLNVFMEKPLSADGPTSRRMLQLADESEKKGLKVGVGLNSRHARNLQQIAEQIHAGKIGDILLMRAYRLHGPVTGVVSGLNEGKPAGMSEVEFQLRKFHTFIWASGGIFSDFYIHLIDHCCWMKAESVGKDDFWPVSAMSLGGRHYRGKCIDQNFDVYSVEYTFPDGAQLILNGRCMSGCENIFRSCAQGTKGYATLSKSGDCNGPSSIYTGQLPDPEKKVWESKTPKGEKSHQTEWDDLLPAIRADKPFNEVRRGVIASLVASMGRISAHTGHTVTYEDMLNSPYEYAPNIDKLTLDGPAPVMPDANGKYPVPQPGIVTATEYPMANVDPIKHPKGKNIKKTKRK